MKNWAEAVGGLTIFGMFLTAGGLWYSLARFIPAGTPRGIATIVAGVAFAGVFVWMLVLRIRRVFAHHGADREGRVKVELSLAALDVALLLVGFALIYQQFGIIDQTNPKNPVVREFWTCLYYSFVTFTTLGYGDFYPNDWSRAVACIQAVTGYLVLGLCASTSASLLQSSGHSKAKKNDNVDENEAKTEN